MNEMSVVSTRLARRRTPSWLWLLLIVMGLALLIVIPFATWLFQQDIPPITVMIDGTEYVYSVQIGALSMGQRAALLSGIYAAVVAVLIAVPLALLVAGAALLLGVVLAVGLPLVIIGVIALVMLSPLLLLAMLLRWLWRSSKRRAPAPGAANIAA